jgi:UDP-N-acetyl-2-amino-2-deoxyglucuronate dehydrogenase
LTDATSEIIQSGPMKLAVIGLGMASKPHLAALRQLAPSVEVTGVYTRNVTRRVEVAAQTGWSSYDSIDAICNDPIVDGAILITPPNARSGIIKQLAGAGKHILTEKPVERNSGNARSFVETCEQADVMLGVVLQHRFRAGAIALGQLLQSGRLGHIHLVRVSVPWWRDQAYYDHAGRGRYDTDGGGVLITQAIHVLDLMLSLTGPVKAVSAMTGTTPLHQLEAEDFATAGLVFQSGALGSVMATTASFPGDAETFELDTEHAALRLKAGELVIHWRNGETETVGEVTGTGGGSDPMDFPCDWHRDLIAEFADAWRAGRAPRVTGREALNVHALIDAIERAAKSHRQENVETNL